MFCLPQDSALAHLRQELQSQSQALTEKEEQVHTYIHTYIHGCEHYLTHLLDMNVGMHRCIAVVTSHVENFRMAWFLHAGIVRETTLAQ